MDKILYFGNFDFIRGFAAANRAISNACVFYKCGFQTIIYGKNFSQFAKTSFAYENSILCHEKEQGSLFFDYTNWKFYINAIQSNSDVKCIVAYNLPSIPFKHVIQYCKKHNIKVIADVTEWYDEKRLSFFKRFFKRIDTNFRMKKLNLLCDGIIVISNYLLNYYSNFKPKIQIYPLMDYVFWEANEYRYKKNVNDGIKHSITIATSNFESKEDFTAIINKFKDNDNISINVVGPCKAIKNSNFNINFYGALDRENMYRIFEKTTFNCVVRKQTRANNAGFPSKFAESIILGIPVIYSNFSDLDQLSKKYNFGYNIDNTKDFLKTGAMVDEELPKLFLSNTYADSFSRFLREIFKNN